MRHTWNILLKCPISILLDERKLLSKENIPTTFMELHNEIKINREYF